MCVITFCVVVLQSAEARYTADFLTLGVGARALAMGGAGTALSDNAYAPYWNPAGLGQLTRYEVSFMHSTLNGEDAYDFVSFVVPLANHNLQDKSHPLKNEARSVSVGSASVLTIFLLPVYLWSVVLLDL